MHEKGKNSQMIHSLLNIPKSTPPYMGTSSLNYCLRPISKSYHIGGEISTDEWGDRIVLNISPHLFNLK